MTGIKRTLSLLLFGIPILCASFFDAHAQSGQKPEPEEPTEIQQPRRMGGDPIRQLNLTPEQRQQIRLIREQLREERAAISVRLSEANKALDEALEADNPDEAAIEKLIRDVAAAQVAMMRMRVLSELRIRRVLTPDQIATLRGLQREARQSRQLEELRRRRETFERERGLPSQQNTLAPTDQRPNPQRRVRP